MAGLIGGLGDGLGATRHLSLAPDPTRDLLLVLLSTAGGVLVSLVAGLALPLVARGLGRPLPPGRWTGFSCGAVAWAAVCIGAALPGWLALLAPALLVGIPAMAHRRAGRPRMVAALVFLALLAVRVADDRRPRDRNVPPASPGPDVVVVVVDGLRADQLTRSPRGDLPAMPELSALADSGLRLSRVSPPATTAVAARSAVLRGHPPWTPAPSTGWARALGDAGWRTAVFGGPEVRADAAAAGFAVRDLDPGWLAGATAGAPGRLWQRGLGSGHARRSARRVVDAWSGWLAGLPAERPAVSVLHLTDVAWPTRPTPPWDTAFERPPAELGADAEPIGACAAEAASEGFRSRAAVRAAYDGAAAAIDALLPEVVARALERPRGAVVLVVGSRGTPMGEEGRWLDAAGGVHPGDLEVPLVAVGTGVPQGSTLGAPVSTPDIVGTIRVWGGLDPVSDARPIPGLARGYPPRTVAHTVGTDGAVVAATPEDLWRRGPDGAVARFVDGQWHRGEAVPPVPVPVLEAVPAAPRPCGD